MAVRSALPWPFRWAMLAIVAGFCAAIALWAFEFGKDIAGLDKGTHEQLQQALRDNASLQTQVALLTEDRNKAQAVADTRVRPFGACRSNCSSRPNSSGRCW